MHLLTHDLYLKLGLSVYMRCVCVCVPIHTQCVQLCNPMDCSPPGSSPGPTRNGLPFPSTRDLPDPGIEPVFYCVSYIGKQFPGDSEWYRICLQHGRPGFNPWVGKIPWRRAWQPIPVFLLGKFYGQRSQAGYSSWAHKELDTTE